MVEIPSNKSSPNLRKLSSLEDNLETCASVEVDPYEAGLSPPNHEQGKPMKGLWGLDSFVDKNKDSRDKYVRELDDPSLVEQGSDIERQERMGLERVHLVNEVTGYFWRVFRDIYSTVAIFQNNHKISKAAFVRSLN
ncbi:hypothetical protein WN51_14011 [Melipona quadrifasciata]|uniref:Uncharacterized protein n=1 Tax=Melipona quadrifasciata TaxID=166423 RepID=A0A0M9A1F1_9HYME|nr:hypothetical protein WN51_14011 [Melipona quadrifasciata]